MKVLRFSVSVKDKKTIQDTKVPISQTSLLSPLMANENGTDKVGFKKHAKAFFDEDMLNLCHQHSVSV